MNASDITALLEQSESEILDFKRQQYPFAGSMDEVKAELLKDILAMANVEKDVPRYILIGVDENSAPSKRVCGADTTLRDADVQQFINSKTNRPVSFLVEVVNYEKESVTVIKIEGGQKRPIFLRQNFGRLKSNVVYIRRGSSTEELSPDSLLEIAHDKTKRLREQEYIEATTRFWNRLRIFLPRFENRVSLLNSHTAVMVFPSVIESRLPLRELQGFLKQAEELQIATDLIAELQRAESEASIIEDYIDQGADRINEYMTNFRSKIYTLHNLVYEMAKKYSNSSRS